MSNFEIDFSLIIPMWNEAGCIPEVLEKISTLLNSVPSLEVIIVNNGSSDNSKDIFNKNMLTVNSERLIIIHKELNTGYGSGIKFGLINAAGKWIGWTHGDLQTDVLDNVLIIERIIRFQCKQNFIFKGERMNRNILDRFISYTLSAINLLINRVFISDINGQPNWVSKDSFYKFKSLPDDSTFELFVLTSLVTLGYELERFPVYFPKRIQGTGSNATAIQKIRFIIKSIKSMCNARSEIANYQTSRK